MIFSNPNLRKKLSDKFIALRGIFKSTISPRSIIGNYGNVIETGCNIMTSTVITSDVRIGKGFLINLNYTIGHGIIAKSKSWFKCYSSGRFCCHKRCT